VNCISKFVIVAGNVMRNSVVLKLLLLSLLAVSGLADATTVQVTASVESSRYLEGTNLTDDSISASLAADWSFKQGGFVGFDCYTSTVDISEGLNNGCDIYAGYFKPINQNNAVSVQLTRHEYSQGIDHKWDFSDIATSWHPSKTTSFTATYSKNWLNSTALLTPMLLRPRPKYRLLTNLTFTYLAA